VDVVDVVAATQDCNYPIRYQVFWQIEMLAGGDNRTGSAGWSISEVDDDGNTKSLVGRELLADVMRTCATETGAR